MNSFDQIMRKESSRQDDIRTVQNAMDENKFNWDKRYDLKYLLSVAKDLDISKSRLQKAVETIDYNTRIIFNKIVREAEEKVKGDK